MHINRFILVLLPVLLLSPLAAVGAEAPLSMATRECLECHAVSGGLRSGAGRQLH